MKQWLFSRLSRGFAESPGPTLLDPATLQLERSQQGVAHARREGRTITEGTRDGFDIGVIQESDGDIVSGFPVNVPRNPRWVMILQP
jgi:hypothetical protein